MRFIILLFINLISIFINYYPKIYYQGKIKVSNIDKFNLDKCKISKFYSFRSYIYYMRSQYINFELMDKIKLHKYLKYNNIPHAKAYYMSNSNFNISKIVTFLLKKNIPFVIKPSHLSEKMLCFIIKNNTNNLDGTKVNVSTIQNKINKFINYKAFKTESTMLKIVKKGIIIQESLDIFAEINEWKCFCVWGKIIFTIWRVKHKNDVIIMDSKFNIYNIGLFNYKAKLPSFLNEIIINANKVSKNIPFIRVDFLWNDSKFIVNEVDICPSGHYGLHNEILLMKLIKQGYNIESRNFQLEILPYLNLFLNRIEYFKVNSLK
tara:strand:- start:2592 stop:3551 length:960 start_codon:yes stop_codon:yes gene_type:complete